jgi:SAM-dependent methyltransferase
MHSYEARNSPIDFSMFTKNDVQKLCYQRSNSIRDLPTFSDVAETADEHEGLKNTILQRIFAEIEENFDNILPALEGISPRNVADIGCGYAFLDLLMYRKFNCRLLLIDVEDTGSIHFYYRKKGAGYTDLDIARKFLEANGVPSDMIATLNPQHEDIEKAENVDLAISLLSCGFHYPAETYASFFADVVDKAVILDLRRRVTNVGLAVLEPLGPTKIIHTGHHHDCVACIKSD